MGHHSLLSHSVNIHHFLEQDRGLRLSQRRERDRDIGRQLGGDGSTLTDTETVLGWWRVIQAQQAGTLDISTGQRVATVRRWLSLALVLAGLLVGGSVCSVALAYDGSHPVNLLAFIGVMVGLPVLLLLLTLVTMAWRMRRLVITSDKVVHGAPAGLHLNSWLLGLWERLSGSLWQVGFGQSNARGRFAYWQVMLFSQLFSVGFFAGALVMFAVLVAVTDLAFGWSTTLQLDAALVHRWFMALAAPWSGLWVEALPDLALVEASRFYRLEGGIVDVSALRLGQWWPFVLMSLLVWGLLPRLGMLGVCRWRVAIATRALLREHSEVTALLDRMNTPAIALGEDVHTEPLQAQPRGDVVTLRNLDDAQVVVWNNALEVAQAQAHLGSLLSDRELQNVIASLPAQVPRVLVMVKAWEPPMLEVLDMLQLLRRHLGTSSSILVTPIGLPEQGFDPAADDVQVWSAAVAKLRDPGIYVAQAEPGLIAVEPSRG